MFFFNMLILLLSYMIIVSGSNWIMVWVGLELNLLSFIMILQTQQMKYFIVQSVGSLMFVMSMLGGLKWLMVMGLLMKMGSVPFYYWFISVISTQPWFSFFILSSLQKLGTLIIISMIEVSILLWIGLLNLMVGGVCGIMMTQFKLILGFSSLGHLGFMMFVLVKPFHFFFYFLLYTVIMYFVMKMINLSISSYKFSGSSLLISIMFMVLAGLPPTLGFSVKWMMLMILSSMSSPMFVFIVLVMSCPMLYYYLNISLSVMMNEKNNKSYKGLGMILGLGFCPLLMV